jgi:hypothetical protein
MPIRADYRNMADDESEVRKGYNQGRLQAGLMSTAILGAAYFGDRAAVAVGVVVLTYLLSDVGDSLYDLTIRLSRTNELLVDGHDERRLRKETP